VPGHLELRLHFPPCLFLLQQQRGRTSFSFLLGRWRKRCPHDADGGSSFCGPWRWRLGATAWFSFFVQWSANAKEPREADGSLKTLPLEWNRAKGRASNVGASARAKNLKT
jgi:hypothetical protein